MSPYNTVPFPGNVATGLIPSEYNASREVLLGFHANLTTFFKLPRLKPAGENQGSRTESVYTQRPAVSPFNGTQRYVLLYLSNMYFQPQSATAYDVERANDVFQVVIFVVSLPFWLTTAEAGGETKATQSIRALTILSITYCCTVTSAPPVMTKEISISSAFVNKP